MCHVTVRLVVFLAAAGVALAQLINFTKHQCLPRCKAPQPRALRLAHELHLFADTFPYMIVLHRCHASGCCNAKGTDCLVSQQVDLNITVYVMETRKYQQKSFTVTNHTECSCQFPTDIIK